jgi:hypothetical protein
MARAKLAPPSKICWPASAMGHIDDCLSI